MPIGTIHAFLRNMNRIWRLREAQHVERLRTRLKEQIDEYARQSNQDKSYESVMESSSTHAIVTVPPSPFRAAIFQFSVFD